MRGLARQRDRRTRSGSRRVIKTPIVVNDTPGFASSRLGVILGAEAICMLESGAASAADIDKAMELGYRHLWGRPAHRLGGARRAARDPITSRRRSCEQFRPPRSFARWCARVSSERRPEGFYV